MSDKNNSRPQSQPERPASQPRPSRRDDYSKKSNQDGRTTTTSGPTPSPGHK